MSARVVGVYSSTFAIYVRNWAMNSVWFSAITHALEFTRMPSKQPRPPKPQARKVGFGKCTISCLPIRALSVLRTYTDTPSDYRSIRIGFVTN